MADLLSAISVLLIFLTILLQTISKEVLDIVKERNPPSAQKSEVKSFRKRLYFLLFLKSFPIFIIYLITAYSLLPTSVSIISNNKIDLWNFDPLKTIFIYIEAGILGLAGYAAYSMIKLIQKIKSVK